MQIVLLSKAERGLREVCVQARQGCYDGAQARRPIKHARTSYNRHALRKSVANGGMDD